MSNLGTLNKTQLLTLAAERNIDVSATATKQEIIGRLSEVKTLSTQDTTGFNGFNSAELLAVASEFGVEVNPNESNEAIINELAEFGVDYEVYQSMHPTVEELVVETAQPALGVKTFTPTAVVEKVLLKMTRKNATFEIRGAKFTRDNPYALVSDSDVDYIIDKVGGFEIARPSEVAQYYA